MKKLLGILFFVAQVAFTQTITAPFFLYAPPAPTWGGGDLWNFDFEDANLAAFESSTGFDHTSSNIVPSLSTAQHNIGAQSILFTDVSGNQTAFEEKALPANKTDLYGTVWIYLTVAPPDGPKSIFHAPNTNGDEYFLNINTTRTVSINGPTQNTTIKATTTTISLNTWTKIRWHMKAAGASSVWEIKIGAETATATTSETSASFTSIKIGLDNFSGVTTYYMDNFSLDDTQYPL